MTESAKVTTLAKGSLAEIRAWIDTYGHDRELARKIYADLRNLSHQLAVKHNFPTDKQKRRIA